MEKHRLVLLEVGAAWEVAMELRHRRRNNVVILLLIYFIIKYDQLRLLQHIPACVGDLIGGIVKDAQGLRVRMGMKEVLFISLRQRRRAFHTPHPAKEAAVAVAVAVAVVAVVAAEVEVGESGMW